MPYSLDCKEKGAGTGEAGDEDGDLERGPQYLISDRKGAHNGEEYAPVRRVTRMVMSRASAGR